MKQAVLSVDGNETKQIDVSETVFGCNVSEGSIYHAIRNELANMRVGTAKVKTRGEVAGTGKKPWRQKGTGRARAGTYQSPVRVGGGVAFGPRPRDYSYRMPKKIKRLALRSILTRKLSEGALSFVEDVAVPSGKTQELVRLLGANVDTHRTVLVVHGDDTFVKRAGRNVAWLTVLSHDKLRANDLFYSRKILVTESAAAALGEHYGVSTAGGAE
ncbi:MAG: 50S ribosomal protein L4 [Spirochaetota bacterium]